jgi:hypothetical protein
MLHPPCAARIAVHVAGCTHANAGWGDALDEKGTAERGAGFYAHFSSNLHDLVESLLLEGKSELHVASGPLVDSPAVADDRLTNPEGGGGGCKRKGSNNFQHVWLRGAK